jgi:hypothetical protein
MKSLKLVDYLPKPEDKVFKLVAIFPNGDAWINEFTLNSDFEDCNEEDPDNTTECFNSLCEITEELNKMQVGKTIYHQIDRDNDDYKSVIMRIK